jgi:hypothetical protein
MDPTLEAYLRSEEGKDEGLSWIAAGAKRYFDLKKANPNKRVLAKRPKAMEDALKGYISDLDLGKRFIEDCLEFKAPDNQSTYSLGLGQSLGDAFKSWTQKEGLSSSLTPTALKKRIILYADGSNFQIEDGKYVDHSILLRGQFKGLLKVRLKPDCDHYLGDRILFSEEGSSECILDHFIGVRGDEDLIAARKVEIEVLQAYNAKAGSISEKITRKNCEGVQERSIPLRRYYNDNLQDEPLQRDLSPEDSELARLLECAQQDHLGATLERPQQMCSGTFIVHIQAPSGSRTCCLVGRPHNSQGNGRYLVYRGAKPTEAVYRCFSPHCQ